MEILSLVSEVFVCDVMVWVCVKWDYVLFDLKDVEECLVVCFGLYFGCEIVVFVTLFVCCIFVWYFEGWCLVYVY